jgi:magnesium chelatase subunit I
MLFTSILGQDAMKLGLILNIIDPQIGGVLLIGDRGTGKRTSVRALRSFLPDYTFLTAKKWVRQSIPLVELPLGATEDRLCGTIHLEKALKSGQRRFEPGLLMKVNGGLLYVDEVNLLDDHLIDLLLDSAASGWNTVERENISLQHPANFILIGSGNPEEGELRPQLLDRFGLRVSLRTPQSFFLRSRIVESLTSDFKRVDIAEGPYECNNGSGNRTEKRKVRLYNRIESAQRLCSSVTINKKYQKLISQICRELQIDGLRGDLVLTRAACALAAWCGRPKVRLRDIETVLPFCLNHRIRKDPLDQMESRTKIHQVFDSLIV